MRTIKAKFTNPLSFWSHRRWIFHLATWKVSSLILHVSTVLTSVDTRPPPGKQHPVQLPWLPKDRNLALEWTIMYATGSVSTWWKHMRTAVTMQQHEQLDSHSYSEAHLQKSSFLEHIVIKKVHLMKHSLHWRNMKINTVQGRIIIFQYLLLIHVLLYWFQKLSSHFVICILHIAIRVIQIKARSCKRIKYWQVCMCQGPNQRVLWCY